MAAAHSLSWRGAAQAHIAKLDVFSEEEPAICGHGTQPPPQQPCHSHQIHTHIQHTQFVFFLKKIINSITEKKQVTNLMLIANITPELSWKLKKKGCYVTGTISFIWNNYVPFLRVGRKRPCRNPLEKQNNPTIQTPFDWWVGQTQLKSVLWLITSSPVTARQSAALTHSRHSKPHHFPHKFLSHLTLVFGLLWSSLQVWFIF